MSDAQFELPATFTLTISKRSPFSGSECVGEPTDFDYTRFFYHCAIYCNGKAIAIESPVFSEGDSGGILQACAVFKDSISYCVTKACLPLNALPQYELIDGIVHLKTENQPNV